MVYIVTSTYDTLSQNFVETNVHNGKKKKRSGTGAPTSITSFLKFRLNCLKLDFTINLVSQDQSQVEYFT